MRRPGMNLNFATAAIMNSSPSGMNCRSAEIGLVDRPQIPELQMTALGLPVMPADSGPMGRLPRLTGAEAGLTGLVAAAAALAADHIAEPYTVQPQSRLSTAPSDLKTAGS